MPTENIASRDLYEFIIRAGVRLEAQNRTVCSAIMILHRLYQGTIMNSVCNYTLGAAALMLASKYEEDNTIGIRDVVNVTYRLLHPHDERMKVGTLQWDIRKGIARLEFIILRELNFHLEFEHPFKLLAVYLDQLRSWIPDHFEKHSIAASATAICRDIYVNPEIVLNNSPESIAIACISIVLNSMEVPVLHCREWYEVLHKTMSESKLQRLEEKIMKDVYKMDL